MAAEGAIFGMIYVMYGTVSISLRLPDGRLIMQRRDAGAPTSPSLLGFFGGHIEKGEDALTAAYRELHEETSLPDSLDLLSITSLSIPSPHNDGSSQLFHLFQTNIMDETIRVYEGTGFEVYSIEELKARLDLTFTARHLLPFLK